MKFRAEGLKQLTNTVKKLLEYQFKQGESCELECLGVTAQAQVYDQCQDLVDRWKQNYNFYGISREDRLSIYEFYVVQELTLTQTRNRTGVPHTNVSRYVNAKGWSRTRSEIRKKLGSTTNMSDYLNSWDAKNKASRLAQTKGVKEPYVCKINGII